MTKVSGIYNEVMQRADTELRERLVFMMQELPEASQRTFKLMYGRNGGARAVDDAIAMSIVDVVGEIEKNLLAHAIKQAENATNAAMKQ